MPVFLLLHKCIWAGRCKYHVRVGVSELITRVVSLQVRLQGDAPQLHLLFGAPRQATGLLSLPRGAAGKKSDTRVYCEKALRAL